MYSFHGALSLSRSSQAGVCGVSSGAGETKRIVPHVRGQIKPTSSYKIILVETSTFDNLKEKKEVYLYKLQQRVKRKRLICEIHWLRRKVVKAVWIPADVQIL